MGSTTPAANSKRARRRAPPATRTANRSTYEWDLDGNGTFESKAAKRTRRLTFTEAEQEGREAEERSPNRVIAVRVKDDEGLTSVARVTVYPGDSPPVPTITSPTPSIPWGVGDQIHLDAGLGRRRRTANRSTTRCHYYWRPAWLYHCPTRRPPPATRTRSRPSPASVAGDLTAPRTRLSLLHRSQPASHRRTRAGGRPGRCA